MKTLIVYYSRSGQSKRVAKELQKKLACDIEEIVAKKSYVGAGGWLVAGKEGSQRKAAEILQGQKNPSEYELVIFGTPIWGWNISSPLRGYLERNKYKFNKIAAFCTMGSQFGKAFEEIEKICGRKLEASVALPDKEINHGNFQLLDAFLNIN